MPSRVMGQPMARMCSLISVQPGSTRPAAQTAARAGNQAGAAGGGRSRAVTVNQKGTGSVAATGVCTRSKACPLWTGSQAQQHASLPVPWMPRAIKLGSPPTGAVAASNIQKACPAGLLMGVWLMCRRFSWAQPQRLGSEPLI